MPGGERRLALGDQAEPDPGPCTFDDVLAYVRERGGHAERKRGCGGSDDRDASVPQQEAGGDRDEHEHEHAAEVGDDASGIDHEVRAVVGEEPEVRGVTARQTVVLGHVFRHAAE